MAKNEGCTANDHFGELLAAINFSNYFSKLNENRKKKNELLPDLNLLPCSSVESN